MASVINSLSIPIAHRICKQKVIDFPVKFRSCSLNGFHQTVMFVWFDWTDVNYDYRNYNCKYHIANL